MFVTLFQTAYATNILHSSLVHSNTMYFAKFISPLPLYNATITFNIKFDNISYQKL